MATGDSSFDEILNGEPTLAELCADVPISTNWYIMGTQLKLNIRKLNEIEDLSKPVPYKVSKMYELWLDTNPQATRRQILETLRMESICQMSLAQQYETRLKEHISIIATDKVLVKKQKEIEKMTRVIEDKQKDNEMLQEKITSLTLQLTERDKQITQMMENMKTLQSQVVQLRDKIKSSDPQLSQKFKEVLTNQEESSSDDKLTQEEPADRVDDNETKDIICHVQLDKQKDIEMLQEKITSLTLQLYQKNRETGSVKWTSDNVTLTSSTVVECKEVICQLKRKQHTTWRIKLTSLSPQSLLTVLTDINECQVRRLVIVNNYFDSNCVSQLVQVVTYNKTMENLFLISSPLLQDTYQLLTTALTNNKVIKILYLWHDNNISDKDIPHLSHLITNNKTLQSLYLTDCPNITKFGKKQLQDVCAKNNSLKRLSINDNILR